MQPKLDGAAYDVFCDQTTAGGGWQLLLTHLDPITQYSGSVSPLATDLNVDSPSTATAYSRDWSTILNDPQPGDEFLLKRSNGDWVRFVQSGTWSGWNYYSDPVHLFFTTGQLYDSEDNELTNYVYFNGCALVSGCGSHGGDGIGFGQNHDWLYDDSSTYGAYGGAHTGGSNIQFSWDSGTTSDTNTPYTYFYRANP